MAAVNHPKPFIRAAERRMSRVGKNEIENLSAFLSWRLLLVRSETEQKKSDDSMEKLQSRLDSGLSIIPPSEFA